MKDLRIRTMDCDCGCHMDRDKNAGTQYPAGRTEDDQRESIEKIFSRDGAARTYTPVDIV